MTINEAKLHWQTAKDDVEHATYLRDLAFDNYIKVVAKDRYYDYYALFSAIKDYERENKKTKPKLLFAL